MTRSIILILLSFLLYSCGAGLNIGKRNLQSIDSQFNGTYSNYSTRVKGARYGSPTLLDLFELYHLTTDSVSIRFDSTNQLVLTYQVTDGAIEENTIAGEFSDKGYYYEVYLRNDKSKTFAHFPIFGKYNINRLRIAINTQADLIVDNQWNNSAHILFLGVGDKGRRQSFFVK